MRHVAKLAKNPASRIQAAVLRAEHRNTATRRAQETGNGPQHRALPRPVFAKDDIELALGKLRGNVSQGGKSSKLFGKAGEYHRWNVFSSFRNGCGRRGPRAPCFPLPSRTP